MKLRPGVAEVVEQLSQATANWDGVMAPYVKAECVSTGSEELISDSKKHCELEVMIIP